MPNIPNYSPAGGYGSYDPSGYVYNKKGWESVYSSNQGETLGDKDYRSGNGTTPKKDIAGDQNKKIDEERKREEQAAKERESAFRAAIDAEYNGVMNELSNQETSVTQQLPLTEQQITQSYGETAPAIKYERDTRLQGLATQGATAQEQTGGVLNQARRAYNELLSGASKFGGSAGQAYGELLGRSTAETMGSAQNALAKTLTEIAGEKSRVQNFYQTKLTDLEKNKNLAIEQARKDFRDEVARINADRSKAQNWKASKALESLANFRSEVVQIQNTASQAKRAIDMWQAERDDALEQARQQSVKEAKLGFTNIGQIASAVSESGKNLTSEGLTSLYGLYGQNADEIDWNDVFGKTVDKEKKGTSYSFEDL